METDFSFRIEGTYSLEDYQRAARLHARMGKLTRAVVTAAVLMVLAAGVVLFLRYQMAEILFLAICFLAGFAGYYINLPRQARRDYESQKETLLPFQIEISNSGITYQNNLGGNITPWNFFAKYRENDVLLLLYHANGTLTMLPKKLLTAGAEDFVHTQLARNHVQEK